LNATNHRNEAKHIFWGKATMIRISRGVKALCANKLLLYETGGHFLADRDTEKELPSTFTGGDISFAHEGTKKTFELAEGSGSQFKYIAFYADCEHQLHPVTSGVRLCLVFNLVATSSKDTPNPSHSVNVSTELKLRSIVEAWRAEENGLKRFGYHMEHKYTPSSFGTAFLKGRDEIVFQTLMNAKNAAGTALFDVNLVLMERYVEQYNEDDEKDIIRPSKVIDSHGSEIDGTGWDMSSYRQNKVKIVCFYQTFCCEHYCVTLVTSE
jgi:hypothetical protein